MSIPTTAAQAIPTASAALAPNAPKALIGLAAIGVGTLALADNLLGHGDHALLRTFWPLGLVGLGLARLFAAPHLGSRIGAALLMAVSSVILGAKLGVVEPQALRAWWPLAPILVGSALIARSWTTRSSA